MGCVRSRNALRTLGPYGRIHAACTASNLLPQPCRQVVAALPASAAAAAAAAASISGGRRWSAAVEKRVRRWITSGRASRHNTTDNGAQSLSGTFADVFQRRWNYLD